MEFCFDGDVREVLVLEQIVDVLLGGDDLIAGGALFEDQMHREDVAFAVEGPRVGVMRSEHLRQGVDLLFEGGEIKSGGCGLEKDLAHFAKVAADVPKNE